MKREKKDNNEQTEKAKRYKQVVIYSAIGLGVGTGLILAIRHFIRKEQKSSSEDKSYDEGAPASFARQLKMAFDNDMPYGWGTNEEKVYEVFNKIPNQKFYVAVKKEYKKQNPGHNLPGDMTEELSIAEADEVMRIKKLRGLNDEDEKK